MSTPGLFIVDYEKASVLRVKGRMWNKLKAYPPCPPRAKTDL